MNNNTEDDQQLQTELNKLFNALPQGALKLNAESELIEWNASALTIFGLPNNLDKNKFQLKKHGIWFDENGEELEEKRNPLWKAILGKKSHSFSKLGFKTAAAFDMVWLKIQIEPASNDNHKSNSVWLFVNDISKEVALEEKYKYTKGIQELMMRTSNDLLLLNPNEFDNTVNRCLGKMGRFIGSDRLYIFSYDMEKNLCSNTYEWCAEGIQAHIHELQNIPLVNFHDWVDAHKKGETLNIPDVSHLDHGSDLYQVLTAQNIQSLVAVPMMKDNNCMGFIGIDSVTKKHDFTDNELAFLQSFANMFVNVQAGVIANKIFAENEAKFRQILENIQDLVWVVDMTMKPLYYSPSIQRVLGYTSEEMVLVASENIFDEETISRIYDLYQKIGKELSQGLDLRDKIWPLEYEVTKKNKEKIWLSSSIKLNFNENNEPTGFIGVSREITLNKKAEAELLKSKFELTERLKEQTCVYEISKLSEIEYLSWDGYLQNIVELIPPGYQFPSQTHVSILFGDKLIQSRNFKESNKKMQVDLTLNKRKVGHIQVYNPQDTEFLPEETKLLENIRRNIEQYFEKIQNAKQLKESEEKYRIIANNTYNWEFWEDTNGNYIYHSPSCIKLTGYTAEELTNFPEACRKLIHPDDLEGYKLHHEHAGKHKEPDTHFFRIINKSGEVRDIEHVCQPVFDNRGQFIGIRGTNIDITERIKADNALKESEQRLRNLLQSQTSYVIRTNMKGEHTYWNSKFEEEYGWLYGTDSLKHGNVLASICEHHHTRTFEVVEKCVQNPGEIFKVELDKPAKNGDIRNTLWEFVCITDDKGIPQEIQCMGIDVTESKKAELKIIESEKKYKTLFNDSPDAYLIIDEGVFVECNIASEKLIGGKREDIIGRSPEIISPKYQPNGKLSSELAQQLLAETFENGHKSFEWEHKKLDGTSFLAHVNLTALNFEGKKVIFTTWRDITDIRKAENDLAKSEARFSQVAEQSQTVIWELDTNGLYTYISPVATKVFGYLPDELVGKMRFYDLHPEEFKGDYKLAAEFAFQSLAELKDYENPIVKKDGSVIWVSSNASPIFDEHNHCIGYRGADIDITNRKLAEREMNKFKVMADQANYGTGITDMEGNILYVNGCMAEMHGYTMEELLGQKMNILHAPGMEEEAVNLIQELLQTGGLTGKELLHARKDGSIFPTITNTKLIANLEGIPPFIAGTIIDNTDRKNFEKEISKLNLAIDQSPVGIIITDLNGILEYVNPAFEKNTGYSKEEVLGQSTRMLKSGITPNEIYHELWSTIKSGKMWQGELVNKRKDGELYWENMTISPIYDEKGVVINYLGIKQDISERKKAEEEILGLNLSLERKVKARTLDLENSNLALEKAREEAEQANHAKSDFLSRMSHELRTPMNSILGFAQLMEMGQLDAGQQKSISHILKSGKHLLDLINEVLDISRIEAGRVSISVEPVEITNVITDVIETLHPLASTKNVNLVINNQIPGLVYVRADKQRFKQILLNLLNNAIKYNNKDGSVWVEIEQIHGNENRIRISVKDNGIGIDPNDLDKVFSPFERVGAEQTNVEGTGLGLAVVKQLIGLMGGNQGVESKIGKGSNFWIELPEAISELTRLKQSGELENTSQPLAKKGGVVLYIEDNRSNIELVEQIVEAKRPGLKLISNMYGKNALPLALENQPDLVLLDLNLPDIHGAEVLEALRSNENTKHIPIVILSADAMPKQLEVLIKAGAQNYLTKPLDIQSFIVELDRYVK